MTSDACAHVETAVLETRTCPYGIRRTRRCVACGASWATVEIPVDQFVSLAQLGKAVTAIKSALHNAPELSFELSRRALSALSAGARRRARGGRSV